MTTQLLVPVNVYVGATRIKTVYHSPYCLSVCVDVDGNAEYYEVRASDKTLVLPESAYKVVNNEVRRLKILGDSERCS
jgi:hypothetical protein